MRFFLRTLLALAVLTALAVGAVTLLIPTDFVRERAIALVREKTGRTLEVRGGASFTVFPSVGVSLKDVALSSPAVMGGGPMLRMEALTVDLKLMPLFVRSVKVERFVLLRPIFDLRVDAQGNRNWDFTKPQAALPDARAPVRTALGDAPGTQRRPRFVEAQAAGPGGDLVHDVRLGAVRIEDGTIVYANALNGASRRIDALNVTLGQTRVSGPLDAEGSLVWRGETVSFKGSAGTPEALLRGGASSLAMTIDTAPVKAGFKGQVTAGENFAAEGDVTGGTPSLRDLADWAASPLPHGKGLGPASLSGRLKYADNVLSFDDTKFSLDGMGGRGNGSVNLKGAKPYVRAALALDKLDLNAWMGETAPAAPASPPDGSAQVQPQPASPDVDAAPRDGQSLTDFIDRLNKKDPKPEVRAWSRRAMNLAALNLIDADVNLNTAALFYEKLKAGPSAVSASLKSGVLTATLNRLSLYGGTGTGRVTVNGARAMPAIALSFDLQDMAALPFLVDWVGFKWISGKADLVANLSGSGESQQQIVSTLQGNGSLRFTNGAIEGINIPGMVRGIREGQLSGWKSDERQKTDFSSLSGTFTMQDGVSANNDLKMVGPLVRMKGSGSIDLPAERIDYALEPRVVASLQGQGTGEDAEGGVVIPLNVEGPLDNPRIAPDLQKIMQNPDFAKDAIDTVGKAIKGLKGKKITGEQVEQLLQGVLGGGEQDRDGAPDGEQKKGQRTQDLINQFFKKK